LLPLARRALGPEDALTLRLSFLLARALFEYDGVLSLEGVLEAEALRREVLSSPDSKLRTERRRHLAIARRKAHRNISFEELRAAAFLPI